MADIFINVSLLSLAQLSARVDDFEQSENIPGNSMLAQLISVYSDNVVCVGTSIPTLFHNINWLASLVYYGA